MQSYMRLTTIFNVFKCSVKYCRDKILKTLSVSTDFRKNNKGGSRARLQTTERQ